MAITARWRPLVDAFIGRESNAPGVYELGDFTDDVVYIGSGDDLQRALRDRLAEMDAVRLLQQAVQFRVAYTTHHRQRERQLHEEYVELHGRPPCCNDSRPAITEPQAPHAPSVQEAA